jgi:hypothetical protein
MKPENLTQTDKLGDHGPRVSVWTLKQQQACLDGRQLWPMDNVAHGLESNLLQPAGVRLGQK